jgi:arylformamidase
MNQTKKKRNGAFLMLDGTKLRIVDLTLELYEQMPTVPTKVVAAHPPKFIFYGLLDQEQKKILSSSGASFAPDIEIPYVANASRFEMMAHGGTHIETPRHFFANKEGIADVDLERLVHKAVRINMSHIKPGEPITSSDLEQAAPTVSANEIPIIYTGWSEKAWGTPRFYDDSPWLESDVAEWILSLGVPAIGFDCYNDLRLNELNKPKDNDLRSLQPLHARLLDAGVLLLEWLTNLSQLKNDRFILVALPLKVRGVEAAPARIIALEEE